MDPVPLISLSSSAMRNDPNYFYYLSFVTRIYISLTHFSLGKRATLSETIIFWRIFVNEKFCILIKISLKFIPEGPIDNHVALA